MIEIQSNDTIPLEEKKIIAEILKGLAFVMRDKIKDNNYLRSTDVNNFHDIMLTIVIEFCSFELAALAHCIRDESQQKFINFACDRIKITTEHKCIMMDKNLDVLAEKSSTH